MYEEGGHGGHEHSPKEPARSRFTTAGSDSLGEALAVQSHDEVGVGEEPVVELGVPDVGVPRVRHLAGSF